MNRSGTFALVVWIWAAGWICGNCQSGTSGTTQDATALMAAAYSKNGLAGPDVQPWHIRATYSAFELNGQFDYQGAYEEWWYDATHYKVRFTNPRFEQTDYATGTALYRDGEQDWVGGREMRLRDSLLNPLPEAAELGNFELVNWSHKGNQGQIVCVLMKYAVRSKARIPDDYFPIACFEPSNPVLRLSTNQGSEQIHYDDIVLFQGHYLAQQIQCMSGGQMVAAMRVDLFEPLKTPEAEVLAVPASARPVDLEHIQFSAINGTGAGGGLVLLKKEPPRLPVAAGDGSNAGLVDMEATVDADGRVADVKLLSGKNMMSVAAMDAVREWNFAPFDVMGKPRPIEAEIKFLFAVR